MLRSDNLKIGDRLFNWGERTYVMGIINLTPDSFSGDGLISGEADDLPKDKNLVNSALDQAKNFVDSGVDILDIGGESTRPGAAQLDVESELDRVIPVVEALTKEFDIPVSVDTYKQRVAKEAISAGANLINDVWGIKADPEMAETVARNEVPVILMHNRSSWAHAEIKEQLGGRYIGIPYDDLLEDIKRELMESVDLARSAGIPDSHIILDPGIGFGKTVEQNLELINMLPDIRQLGYPLLFGPSRKSFIGYTLDLPPDQRMAGTAAAIAIGIDRGADIIRVHDVEFMHQVARMTDAIVR